MKQLTLSKSFKLCLQQWKWIIQQRKQGNKLSIDRLKQQWLSLKGFPPNSMPCHCFFCHYMGEQLKMENFPDGIACSFCPGRIIDSTFSCTNLDYHYYFKSEKFYKKLVQLNRKRIIQIILSFFRRNKNGRK